jgi:hypothetical protein
MSDEDDWQYCGNCRMIHPVGHVCKTGGYHSLSEPGKRLSIGGQNDPTEPLIDWAGDGTCKVQAPELNCPCAGTGWLSCEWLYKYDPACTCGAGDPNDHNLLHDVSCDSVPCPFCPLEYKGRHTFDGED